MALTKGRKPYKSTGLWKPECRLHDSIQSSLQARIRRVSMPPKPDAPYKFQNSRQQAEYRIRNHAKVLKRGHQGSCRAASRKQKAIAANVEGENEKQVQLCSLRWIHHRDFSWSGHQTKSLNGPPLFTALTTNQKKTKRGTLYRA